jgi:hypothetical protein
MRVLLVLMLAVILLSGVASAEIPYRISYQARLTDDSGVGINGSVDLVFAIYNDSLASVELWQEKWSGVTVTDGLFTVLLGSTDPLPPAIFEGQTRYLLVTVNDEESDELIPMVSVPYAYGSIHSDIAQYANGADSANHAISSDTAQYAVTAGNTPSSVWEQTATTVYLPDITDKVGIGTTTPTEKLHVAGNLRLEENNSLLFGSGDTEVRAAVGGDLQVTAGDDLFLQANDKIMLGHNGTAANMIFDPVNKLVGLGTSAPTEMLHLYNEDDGGGAFMKIQSNHLTNWGEAGIRFETPDNRWHLRMDDDSHNNLDAGAISLRSQDINAEVMVWQANGNVGIGLRSPQERLHVAGNVQVNSALDVGTILTTGGDATIGGALSANSITGNYAANSIDATDISNEAGLTYNGEYNVEDAITGPWASYFSHSITTPTNSGYILALATATVRFEHGVTDFSYVFMAITPYASPGPTEENSQFQLGDDVSAGTYTTEISVQRVFPVSSAGSHTFHINAVSGEDNAYLENRHLTLIYIPTAYVIKDGDAETTLEHEAIEETPTQPGPAYEHSLAEMAKEIQELKRRMVQLESQ